MLTEDGLNNEVISGIRWCNFRPKKDIVRVSGVCLWVIGLTKGNFIVGSLCKSVCECGVGGVLDVWPVV